MAPPAIDTAAIASFCTREVGVDVTGTSLLHDGLNRSIAISTADTERAYVLRRSNKLRDRETFNTVGQEYEILRGLQSTTIDAPEPVARCTDESVLGDPFLVMTYVDGEAIPLGDDLPERYRRPADREHLATRLVETLATLHTVDVDPFAEPCDQRPLRTQVDRVVEQFDDATNATGDDWPGLRRVADWLRASVPSETETALVHGDFRPGNVRFAGGQPDVSGVLDWETAFLGEPLVELGYLLLRWRDAGDPAVPLDELRAGDANEAVIEDLQSIDERGLAPYTSDPGSPSRRELVSIYEGETGRTFEHERFYRAFAAFILATVWTDLRRLQLEAGDPSTRGPYIEYLSMVATSIVDGEFEL